MAPRPEQDGSQNGSMTRRAFLKGAAATGFTAALSVVGGVKPALAQVASPTAGPDTATSKRHKLGNRLKSLENVGTIGDFQECLDAGTAFKGEFGFPPTIYYGLFDALANIQRETDPPPKQAKLAAVAGETWGGETAHYTYSRDGAHTAFLRYAHQHFSGFGSIEESQKDVIAHSFEAMFATFPPIAQALIGGDMNYIFIDQVRDDGNVPSDHCNPADIACTDGQTYITHRIGATPLSGSDFARTLAHEVNHCIFDWRNLGNYAGGLDKDRYVDFYVKTLAHLSAFLRAFKNPANEALSPIDMASCSNIAEYLRLKEELSACDLINGETDITGVFDAARRSLRDPLIGQVFTELMFHRILTPIFYFNDTENPTRPIANLSDLHRAFSSDWCEAFRRADGVFDPYLLPPVIQATIPQMNIPVHAPNKN